MLQLYKMPIFVLISEVVIEILIKNPHHFCAPVGTIFFSANPSLSLLLAFPQFDWYFGQSDSHVSWTTGPILKIQSVLCSATRVLQQKHTYKLQLQEFYNKNTLINYV